MNEFEKLLAQVKEMRASGASDDQIGKYLEARGYTPESFKQALSEFQTPRPITARDLGRSAAQGLTMEFADELAGVGAALVPGGRGYREARDELRANDARFSREHPRANLAARIGGGLATAVIPATGLARGAQTLGQTAMRGAGLGAAYGGIAGLGAGEGGVREQAASTGQGALAGYAFGAAAPVVSTAVGRTARNVGGAMMNVLGRRADPSKVADEALRRTLERARRSTADVRAALAASREAAPDAGVTIADAAGEPGRRMARGASAFPTEGAEIGQEVMGNRDLGRQMRLEGGLTRATGQQRTDLPSLLEELEARFRPEAQRRYDAAYAALDNTSTGALGAIDDPVINTLLDTPEIGEIWEAALSTYNAQRQLLRAAGSDIPELVPIVERVNTPAGVQWQRTGALPDTRTLDFLKRGMDAYVDRRMTPGQSMNKPLGHAMSQVRDRLLERLDEINPLYRDARAFYRGGLDANRALEAGRTALHKSRDEIAKELREMGEHERNVYRLAAQDALRQEMRQPGGSTRLMNPKNQELRERLRMIFASDEEYQSFMRMLGVEANMARTERMVTGGSPTSRIDAEKDDILHSGMAEFAMDVGRGGVQNTILARIARVLHGAPNMEEVADQIARMLMEVDPAQQAMILQRLDEQTARAVRNVMLARTGQMAGGAAVGGIIPRADSGGMR